MQPIAVPTDSAPIGSTEEHAKTQTVDCAQLTSLCQSWLGPALRTLCLFGSQVVPQAAQPNEARGVPDLLAILDEGALDPWLRQQRRGVLLRLASPHLAPLTLALSTGERTLAKLNLVESQSLFAVLNRLPDVYLAGRLSKALRPLYSRDAACERELTAAADLAALQIARLALCGLPRVCDLADAARTCAALSYRAELRPEGKRTLQALFATHRRFFIARFVPLLTQEAIQRGFHHDRDADCLRDERPAAQRIAGRLSLTCLLWRSRLRSLLRWPKQMLSYRGWWSYAVDKVRRARRYENRS